MQQGQAALGPRHILVTGGAGFVGARVARRAVEAGHRVTVIDSVGETASLSAIWDLEEAPGWRLVPADLSGAGTLRDVLREAPPDAVVHLAAETRGDRLRHDPAGAEGANLVGTLALFHALRDHAPAARAITLSDAAIHGPQVGPGRIDAATAPDPRDAPMAGLAARDQLAAGWRAEGLAVSTLVAPALFGPHQRPDAALPALVRAALDDGPIPVPARSAALRDWLHVDDAAEACLAALDVIPGRYALAPTGSLADADMARGLGRLVSLRRPGLAPPLERMTDVPAPWGPVPPRMDGEAFAAASGWSPRIGFDAGLGATLDWYLGNEGWWRPALRRTEPPGRALRFGREDAA